MKYHQDMYSQTIERGSPTRYDFRPRTQRHPETDKLITMVFGQQCVCRNKDIFTAAQETFGEDIHIDVWDRANFAPKLDNVITYGDPIGTVSPRPREAFYVYRRASHGGSRPGAGRPPVPDEEKVQGIRPWVPIQDDEEADTIRALSPEERRRRLLSE